MFFVTKRFHQHLGIDYFKMFTLVFKSSTIQLILSLVVSIGWTIKLLDVSNAFLYGCLDEIVYMVQPRGYVDRLKPHHVCYLRKSLYSLK